MNGELDINGLNVANGRDGRPAYKQIASILVEALDRYPGGTSLPAEAQLAERFHVSRGTISAALRELENRGYIDRIQGLGSFKKENRVPKFTRFLNEEQLSSFTGDLQRSGFHTREEIVECKQEGASSELSSSLACAPNSSVWKIARRIFADEEPVVFVVSYLRTDIYPEVDANAIALNSLYGFLAHKYGPGLLPTWAKETYTALNATSQLGKLLSVRLGTAILCSKRTAFLQSGTPVELVSSFMRGDLYSLEVTILPGLERLTTSVATGKDQ